MLPTGFCCDSRSTERNGVVNICTVQEQCVFKHDRNIWYEIGCLYGLLNQSTLQYLCIVLVIWFIVSSFFCHRH